jgi:hypothetical protein
VPVAPPFAEAAAQAEVPTAQITAETEPLLSTPPPAANDDPAPSVVATADIPQPAFGPPPEPEMAQGAAMASPEPEQPAPAEPALALAVPPEAPTPPVEDSEAQPSPALVEAMPGADAAAAPAPAPAPALAQAMTPPIARSTPEPISPNADPPVPSADPEELPAEVPASTITQPSASGQASLALPVPEFGRGAMEHAALWTGPTAPPPIPKPAVLRVIRPSAALVPSVPRPDALALQAQRPADAAAALTRGGTRPGAGRAPEFSYDDELVLQIRTADGQQGDTLIA